METQQIHEKYHSKTRSYSRIIAQNNFTYKIILPILNKYIHVNSPKKILDIGCGSGPLAIYLAHQGHAVHGIDISKRAIETCIDSARELGIKNAKFEVLNFPKDKIDHSKYDIVLFLEVIEHLEDDLLALKKINRILSPGGLLILSTPSKNAPLYKLGLTRSFDRKVGHLRRYRKSEISKMINTAGFEIMEVKKNEGLVRNFLFTNSFAGHFVRFIKFFMIEVVTTIDNVSLLIFGESDYIIVAKKHS